MQHSESILIFVSSISTFVLNIVSVSKLNLRSLVKCEFYFICHTSFIETFFFRISAIYI